MPDFFAEDIQNGVAHFTTEDSHHALRVLRLREGESLGVSFEGRRYLASALVTDNGVTARILEETASTEPKTRITLYQGWAKGDKMEQIVRQATELGAASVVPVLFSRCVARPENAKRMERLNKIAREAAMQSKRTLIPQVEDTITVTQLRERLKAHEQALVAYELETAKTLPEAMKNASDIALIIGPEGGLTPDEVDTMGATPLSLGPRILRTETAGIAAIAQILALNNDYQ